jgi:hypothetical protein
MVTVSQKVKHVPKDTNCQHVTSIIDSVDMRLLVNGQMVSSQPTLRLRKEGSYPCGGRLEYFRHIPCEL